MIAFRHFAQRREAVPIGRAADLRIVDLVLASELDQVSICILLKREIAKAEAVVAIPRKCSIDKLRGDFSYRETIMTVPHGLIEALLATASDAIIATDHAGTINFWNPGAVRIFGFTADEAIGRSLDLIIPDNLRARHWTGFRHVMETGTSRYGHGDLLSVPALAKGGRRISVEFTIAMMKDEQDRPIGTVAILRDVTRQFEERRKLKRQLADATRGG